MKSSRASKKFTLGCSALLLFSLMLAGTPHVSEASFFSDILNAGKGFLGLGSGVARLTGVQACYKGSGMPGALPGITVPAVPSCNGGVNAVGVPIPDCAVPGAACVVPLGCLNLVCGAYKNAIYDPGSRICGCSEPDIQSAAQGVISNFLGL